MLFLVPITPQPVEKPPPERRGSIPVEEILSGVEGERRPRPAATLEIYSGTVEVDQKSAGITTPIARPGHQRRPHPRQLSSRFRFCPVARTSASILTFSSILSRNRSMPCQALPSPNSGSTHTFRLRIAFL
jgi:hypothetical protein